MELFSDDDAQDMITVQMVCHSYLEDECLPAIKRMQANHSMAPDDIVAGAVSPICKLMHSDSVSQWIAKAESEQPRLDDTLPTLATRTHNICHTQVRMNVTEPESAASVYLPVFMTMN